MRDDQDDPIEAAIKQAKAAKASEAAAATAQNATPSNPRLPRPTFAAESTSATSPKPGDRGVIDPVGMAANAYQGLTANWGDEAAGVVGGVAKAVTGGRYADGFDAARSAVNREADTYAANHHVAAGVTQAVGALAPMAFGVGAAAKGAASLTQLAKAGAKAGALWGGVAGAGAGDGVLDRTGKAVMGAGAGALVGGALPPAVVGATRAPGAAAAYAAEKLGAEALPARGLAALARGTDKVGRTVGNFVERMRNGDTPTPVEVPILPTRERQAMDALTARGVDPTALSTAHAANVADHAPPMPFATLLPDHAQRTVRAADALSPNGATRTALDARIRQQGPNLAAHVPGPEITPSVTIPALKADAQKAAGALFDVANAQPPVRAPEINELLETPLGQQLYEKARTRAANDLQWRADLPSAQELAARPAQAGNEAFIRTMQGDLPPAPIPKQLPAHIDEAVERTVRQFADDGVAVTPELRRQITGATLNAAKAADDAKGVWEPKVLHWWKIAADDAVASATTDAERALADQYRRRLLSVLGDDTRLPGMAQALKTYEIPMASADAIGTAFMGDGARALPGVLNAQPRAVKAELARLGARDAERGTRAAASYRDSGKQAVRDMLQKVRPDRDVTKTLFPDGPKDDLVQALLDEADAGRFGRQLEREAQVGRARDNILGNSSTARNQADIQLLNEQANAGMLPLSARGTTLSEDIVRSGNLRTPLKARAADWLANRRLAKTRAVAGEIDRLGALDNADDIATLLQTWADRQRTVYQPLGLAARATGRIAGQKR